MKQIYSVGIITYIKHNRELNYLLLHSQAGCWDFPKGQMKPGETKEETACRELEEETGLMAELDPHFEKVLSYNFSHNTETICKTDYMYIGQAQDTTITLSDEHTDYAWLPFKKALDTLTYDDTKALFKEAHEYVLKI